MSAERYELHAGAGAAKVLFPQEMFPTDGFCQVHDDPHIRVLVMESGIRFAIVAAELVMVPKPFVKEIRAIVREETGVPEENIWVHCNHVITTPHTPGPRKKGPGSPEPPVSEEDRRKKELFLSAVMGAVRQAAAGAAKSFRPAVLSVGAGRCAVGRSCRSQEVEHGLRSSEDGMGQTDDEMTVLRFQDLSGVPIGFVIHYNMKPCAIDNAGMGSCTRQVSSDVPGRACALVEERFGAPALYCMGAAADQHPREQAMFERKGPDGKIETVDLGVACGLELVERYGKIMGEDAAAIIDAMGAAEPVDGIRRAESQFQWPALADPKKPAAEPPAPAVIQVETARIGQIALVATNPEISCATGLQLKEASPFQHTLLLAMTNGPTKYMPCRAAFEHNTREAQRAFAEPGAAEKFVEVAAELLREMKANA